MFEKFWPWHKAVKATSSPYIEAIDRFKLMSSPGAMIYKDIRKVEVLFSTIDVYLEVILRAIDALASKQHFSYIGYEPRLKPTARRLFYQNKDGHLLDVNVWHMKFIMAASELLKQYEIAVENDSPTVLDETNLQKLLPLINNLIYFSEAFTMTETPLKNK